MFLILSLPRSRSAWLSHYLSYPYARPPKLVGHEILGECDSVEKFINSYKNGMWGSCETSGSHLWRIIRQELPECRIVLVRRPLIEVVRSILAMGLAPDLAKLAMRDEFLNVAAAVDPEIVSIPYHLLSEPFIGKWLFEACLEEEFDFDWWARLVATKITINVNDYIKRADYYRTNIDKVEEDAKNWKMSIRHLN